MATTMAKGEIDGSAVESCRWIVNSVEMAFDQQWEVLRPTSQQQGKLSSFSLDDEQRKLKHPAAKSQLN